MCVYVCERRCMYDWFLQISQHKRNCIIKKILSMQTFQNKTSYNLVCFYIRVFLSRKSQTALCWCFWNEAPRIIAFTKNENNNKTVKSFLLLLDFNFKLLHCSKQSSFWEGRGRRGPFVAVATGGGEAFFVVWTLLPNHRLCSSC